jgi:hypothetical protein
VLWTVYGLFSASNSLFLVALFQTGHFPDASVGVVVSAVGVTLSVVWILIQYRAIAHIENYERIINSVDSELLKVTVRTPSARNVMRLSVGFFIFVWSVAFLYFLLRLLAASA